MGNEKKHPQADWIKIVSIVVVFRVSKRIGEELPRLSRWEYSQITVPITKGDQSWELFPKLCVMLAYQRVHIYQKNVSYCLLLSQSPADGNRDSNPTRSSEIFSLVTLSPHKPQ